MMISNLPERVLRKLRRAATLAPWLLRLSWSRKHRIVFELPMLGEFPYLTPLLQQAKSFEKTQVFLTAAHDELLDDAHVQSVIGNLVDEGAIWILKRNDLLSLIKLVRFDLFVTSEQFSDPAFHPAVCIFHGHPSKGLTFNRQIIERYEHFFLLGPLHEKAYQEAVERESKHPLREPELHRTGYPKSDALIRNDINLSIDPYLALREQYRRIVLYAPAFNEHASLRTCGIEIVQTLASIPGLGVIVKLAPDCLCDTSNFAATGGVNWRLQIESLCLENVTVASSLEVDPWIALCDWMLTDVSGVAHECLSIGKPVVFYDCPDFYKSVHLQLQYDATWEEFMIRDTVNAGRRFGAVVKNLDELRHLAVTKLQGVDAKEYQRALLYNPGCATSVVVGYLTQILRGAT